MTKPIPVALLGYGYAGKTIHAPLIASVSGLRLDCVFSSNEVRVRSDWPQLYVSDSPGELFDRRGVELVVIATPNDTHFELARRALLAGKHVVVDKPFTVSLEQAQELTALATHAGRMLSVFHNRRWDADFLTVRTLIGSGVLGDVLHFESHIDRYRPAVRARWREQAVPGGGLWFDLGPHLVDQALQLFGWPEAVYADFELQREGARNVDYFHVLLRYRRLRVVLHATTMAACASPRFLVHGTLGSYVKQGVDPQEDALKRGESPSGPDWGRDDADGMWIRPSGEGSVAQSVPTQPGDYRRYYAALSDAIRSGAPNPVPPEQALSVMQVLECATSSAEAHRELTLMPL